MSGPVGTQILADFGAEVIKIEHPVGGDDSRIWSPKLGGESGTFLSCNRNKRSVALNLKDPLQLQAAKDLISKADVLVENFSPGVMDRLGLSYADLASQNPQLIYCSISGYGTTGVSGRRPGYDSVFQAESGLMSVTGEPDGPPMRSGPPVVDYTTGLNAAIGILSALIARRQLGRGQHLEIAMFDVAINMLGNFGMNYLVSGEVPQRPGNFSPIAAPIGVVDTADGLIYLSCGNDRLWQRLLDVLDRPELRDNPSYTDNSLRNRNRGMLFDELNAIFKTETRDRWMDKLIRANIPAGAVRSMEEAYLSDTAKDRTLVSEIAHPTAGTVPTVSSPFRLSETPVARPVAPPLLGADTLWAFHEVLGYSDEKIAAVTARNSRAESAA
jgi:formyl-CoA transferase